MSHDTKLLALSTRLIHAGAHPDRHDGAVATPIYQSSTYLTDPAVQSYEQVRYIRLNNGPNHQSLHHKLAAIEGAQAALSFSSGMGAISATLFTLLSSGDHLIASNDLYGATLATITEELPRFGVSFDLVDTRHADQVRQHLKPNTRMIWVESMSNPLLRVADLHGIAALGREHDLITVVDNTFCSPVNLRPLDLGFSLCVHSASKYLNGHTDLVAGCVSGEQGLIERLARFATHQGACLDPHTASQLERGMKTLTLRVARQNATALALAEQLAAHPEVTALHYPGLSAHPQHERASALCSGFGGVLSFTLRGDQQRALRLVQALELASFAPSLGGVETLVTLPALTSHASVSATQREAMGISPELVRLSVGIEEMEDLRDDLLQAIAQSA